jgi:hypothetical protein
MWSRFFPQKGTEGFAGFSGREITCGMGKEAHTRII